MQYVPLSYRILSKSCHIRNVQIVTKVFSSHKIQNPVSTDRSQAKILTKPQSSSRLQTEAPLLTLSNNPSATLPLLVVKPKRSKKEAEPEWREMTIDLKKLPQHCLMLSKFRLTSLVVITSMAGYAMSPAMFLPLNFLCCTLGTGLVSSAANSINQFLEVPYDSQMSRTKNRVLVKGYLTPLHAVSFAAVAGTSGLLVLYYGTNGLTAGLGAANLILYTSIYTPLKRISILNTWVGSIVGAIPPLMGWAACEGSLGPGAWIMAGLLYAWQFPHFNALSWNLRPDYSKAGYRMMAVTEPGLCRRVALRYTLVIAGLSGLAPLLDVTHWSFAIFSLPINSYFAYLAYKFYRESDSGSSRKLFRFSLLHLPLLMGLLLVTKKQWWCDGVTETYVTPVDGDLLAETTVVKRDVHNNTLQVALPSIPRHPHVVASVSR